MHVYFKPLIGNLNNFHDLYKTDGLIAVISRQRFQLQHVLYVGKQYL